MNTCILFAKRAVVASARPTSKFKFVLGIEPCDMNHPDTHHCLCSRGHFSLKKDWYDLRIELIDQITLMPMYTLAVTLMFTASEAIAASKQPCSSNMT